VRQLLTSNELCLLDGAVGTELERRGYKTYLPLWTANAIYDCPDLLRDIHIEYIHAGANIITANTFRTSSHTLSKADKGHLTKSYTVCAVEIAREAVDRSGMPAAVAGSIAPLEDCYTPELVPDVDEIRRDYMAQLEIFDDVGVDMILLETMINRVEIEVITELLKSSDIPFMISFTAEPGGKLLDGTDISTILTYTLEARPMALLLNCRTPETITGNLRYLSGYGAPIGGYGNGTGEPGGPTGWCWDHGQKSDLEYFSEVRKWYDIGARVIGGCCGTSPSTIRMLADLVK
jgi:homocysteine S-methyltransferase